MVNTFGKKSMGIAPKEKPLFGSNDFRKWYEKIGIRRQVILLSTEKFVCLVMSSLIL
jgi:hypothetical protein